MEERWSADRLPDLCGKTAMVTGATGGIGGPVARDLARAGALGVVPALAARLWALSEELTGVKFPV